MKSTLMIKDLSVSKELDRKAMSAVCGGERDQGIANNQVNGQALNLGNSVGNGSIFAGPTTIQSDLVVNQTASNYAYNSNEKGFGLFAFPFPV